MTILPSLKLIALDISELHNHKKEIEVFYLKEGLGGGKKSLCGLRGREAGEIVSVQTFEKEKKKKTPHFRMSHEAWPFPG